MRASPGYHDLEGGGRGSSEYSFSIEEKIHNSPSSRSRRRNRFALLITASIAIVIVVGVVLVSARRHRRPPPLQLVFGYGSVLNNDSLLLTISTPPKHRLPVVVHNHRRSWEYQDTNSRMTAVALTKDVGESANGVLFDISEADIKSLDARESGYIRHKIPLQHIKAWNRSDYAIDADLSKLWNFDAHEIVVWTYVMPSQASPPRRRSRMLPILQTYVDIVLAGCDQLAGPEFAVEFVRSTHNWEVPVWIDDRLNPHWTRYFAVASETRNSVDQALAELVPEAFEHRRTSAP